MRVHAKHLVPLLFGVILGGPFFAVPCQAEIIRAFVSIPPQAYFVERIGGDYVRVEALVGPGDSPATYEPTPRQVAELESADIYFRIGTPFENTFLKKIARALPDLHIVDTRRNVELRFFRKSGARQVADPHIWLDPLRVKTQARTICESLSTFAPSLSKTFERNLEWFLRDLDQLDQQIRAVLAPVQPRKILVFHPAFGYFCDSYGLEQIAVETEGKAPSPKRLAELIETAKAEDIRIIFVQPQYSKKAARTVAQAVSGSVIPLDPLAEDYLDNLRRMAETIRNGLTTP